MRVEVILRVALGAARGEGALPNPLDRLGLGLRLGLVLAPLGALPRLRQMVFQALEIFGKQTLRLVAPI